MKTHLLFLVIILNPFLLSAQGVVQKQYSTQTSQSGYHNQTNQGGSQNGNSYHPTQMVQQTGSYTQPQNQQYTVVKQNSGTLQKGYSQGYSGHTPHSDNTQHSYSSGNKPLTAEKATGMLALARKPVDAKKISEAKGLRTDNGQTFERKEAIQKPNLLVNIMADSSSRNFTGVTVMEKIPLKEFCLPQSPEVVYKLTPTLRLRYVSGCFSGWADLNGFGVHIAAFVNYNYCKGVANYIRKKYHATSYIFEDQSGYPHYHLVFGRWMYFKSAQIFEGKVRRDAPHAFVCRWRNDFSVLLPDGMIMKAY